MELKKGDKVVINGEAGLQFAILCSKTEIGPRTVQQAEAFLYGWAGWDMSPELLTLAIASGDYIVYLHEDGKDCNSCNDNCTSIFPELASRVWIQNEVI